MEPPITSLSKRLDWRVAGSPMTPAETHKVVDSGSYPLSSGGSRRCSGPSVLSYA